MPQLGVRNAIEIHARERYGRITLHVPCEIAVQDIDDVGAAQLFVIVHAHIPGVVIDRARVVRHLHLRPSIGEVVLLTDIGDESVANKLNRFHVHGAHGLGGRFNRLTGVHRLSGCRSGSQRDEDNEKNCKTAKCSPHLPLFIGSTKSITCRFDLVVRLYASSRHHKLTPTS